MLPNDAGEASHDAECAVDAANDAEEVPNDAERAVDAANDAGDSIFTESRICCNLFTSNFYTTLICAHFFKKCSNSNCKLHLN